MIVTIQILLQLNYNFLANVRKREWTNLFVTNTKTLTNTRNKHNELIKNRWMLNEADPGYESVAALKVLFTILCLESVWNFGRFNTFCGKKFYYDTFVQSTNVSACSVIDATDEHKTHTMSLGEGWLQTFPQLSAQDPAVLRYFTQPLVYTPIITEK